MSNFQLSVLCLIITLGIYSANKRLYRRFRKLPLMPLVLTPALLVLMLVFGHISWQNYIGESHWLLWLLGRRPLLLRCRCTITSRLSNATGCRSPLAW
ncbi:CidA-associated membrane protein CidB [Salmonella enterica subsp. arizonae]|nr:CidA-associated membrane protein CidB [Salmonella enterica subsp. arizonae]